MENKIKIISLFDGISCGLEATKRLGWKDVKYYASEIDKYAEAVSKYNHPEIIRLGDVTKVIINKSYDLLIGGSPCQSFSNAGNGKGFDGTSGLFWEYIRILREIKKYNPDVKFLLENVKMKKEWQDIISKELGVEPIEINSNLVSAQNRRRLYWTNIDVKGLPQDKKIMLKDIVEKNVAEKYYLTEHQLEYATDYSIKRGKTIDAAINKDKARCLLARAPKRACHDATLIREHIKIVNATKKGYLKAYPGDGLSLEFPKSKTRRGRVCKGKCPTLQCSNSRAVITNNLKIRVLIPLEFERLQTLKDNYTRFGNFDGVIKDISDNQRYKMIGNAWTADTVAWILEFY